MSAAIMEIRPPSHRFTVEDYHRMGQAGVLDSRVELIEGAIIDMAPIGISHNCAVDRLNELLIKAVEGKAGVRVQGSFRLSHFTEPQPDLILLKRREDFYAQKFAGGEDTLLVIEVSDTTFQYDRNVKVPLYARHGIPEVWIMDVSRGQLHFFRGLKDGAYTDVSSTEKSGSTPLPGLRGLVVDLSGLPG